MKVDPRLRVNVALLVALISLLFLVGMLLSTLFCRRITVRRMRLWVILLL